MGQLVYLKDVVTLKLDLEKCTGCGMCLLVCPQAVLSMTNGTAEIAFTLPFASVVVTRVVGS